MPNKNETVKWWQLEQFAEDSKEYTQKKIDEAEPEIRHYKTWAEYESDKDNVPAEALFIVDEDNPENKIPKHNLLEGRDEANAHPYTAIEGLQAQLDKKTDVAKTQTLESRMNQFAKLPDGSTAGDAELADIRVGADGKTYENAGEAVRGQVSGLKETIAEYEDDLSGFSDSVSIEIITNSSFSVSGFYLGSRGAATANANFNITDFIDVSNISDINFYSTSSMTSGYTVYFYTAASESAYIAESGVLLDNIQEKRTISVPHTAKYVRLSLRTNLNEHFFAVQIPKKQENTRLKSDSIKECTFNTELIGTDSDGYFYRLAELPTTHKNFVWLKSTESDIKSFTIDTKISDTSSQIRIAVRFVTANSIFINFQNSNGNMIAEILDGDTLSALNNSATYKTINPVPFSIGKHNVRITLIGRTIFIYVDDVLFSLFTHTKVNQIKDFGFNFRGSGAQSHYGSYTVSGKKRFAHFSLDDQLECLKDITDNADSYNSAFTSPYFNKLYKLHNEYGCKFTLMLFGTNGTFSLSDVTTKFRTEFANNASWLKFAYHGSDETTNPKDMTVDALVSSVNDVYSQIDRFASVACIDKVPRMSFFSCTKDQAIALKNNGLVTGFLTADDVRNINTGLDANEKEIMENYDSYTDYTNGITYFRTEPRLDINDYPDAETIIKNMDDKYSNINNDEIFIVFGHSIRWESMQTRFEAVAEWLFKHGFRYDYPMNNTEY